MPEYASLQVSHFAQLLHITQYPHLARVAEYFSHHNADGLPLVPHHSFQCSLLPYPFNPTLPLTFSLPLPFSSSFPLLFPRPCASPLPPHLLFPSFPALLFPLLIPFFPTPYLPLHLTFCRTPFPFGPHLADIWSL